jgi:hypothetical protein
MGFGISLNGAAQLLCNYLPPYRRMVATKRPSALLFWSWLPLYGGDPLDSKSLPRKRTVQKP